MKHRVAIGTNWIQVVQRVEDILLADFAQRLEMVNVDEAGTD